MGKSEQRKKGKQGNIVNRATRGKGRKGEQREQGVQGEQRGQGEQVQQGEDMLNLPQLYRASSVFLAFTYGQMVYG